MVDFSRVTEFLSNSKAAAEPYVTKGIEFAKPYADIAGEKLAVLAEKFFALIQPFTDWAAPHWNNFVEWAQPIASEGCERFSNLLSNLFKTQTT